VTSPAPNPPSPDAAAGASGGERLRALAALPLASPGGRGARLITRVRASERAIEEAYKQLTALPRASLERSHAAEWLLDNHYVVQRAVRGLTEEFPVGFERRLRLIAGGELDGLPLAYVVARELVAIGQCGVDVDSLPKAVAELQTSRSLTIAELWALPAMLRLALLEELALAARDLAAVVEPAALERQGEEECGRVIASAIRSLRALEVANWKQFFERTSAVERILAKDPAAVYRQMDFDTRDSYRKAVEVVASWTAGADEEAVATAAVRLAGRRGDPRRSHVGHFLVAGGRLELERELGARPRWSERWRRWLTTYPTATYLGSTGGLSAAAAAGLAAWLLPHATAPMIALAVAVGLIPIVSVAVTLVNFMLTHVLPPRALPKLDFAHGIASPWRTLVAVPALLSDIDEIDALLASLEIRYLANRDRELQFALLTDLCDADREHLPADDVLVGRAVDGIAALNQRHGANGQRPFQLLHRARRWNPSEGRWMGWERKRGKLRQLNRLILRAAATAAAGQQPDATGSDFQLHVGDTDFLAAVRFVIVLDADTDLPRDAAKELAGALAHPLNRAELDRVSQRVVEGYSILQPRVEISPLSARTSRFAALFAPAAGLDPYTRAVSDVYQDLFGEGTFVGKGIYDVADFERSLHDVAPDNALLSHDLFEGLLARAALLSDTILLEGHPSHYLAHTRRIDRWVRGDWQLLPWLGRWVPAANGGRHRNRLRLIGRWKILDNLRRSLVAPALVLWLLTGWFLVPSVAAPLTLAAVCVPGVPALLDVLGRLRAAAVRRLRGPAAAPEGESLRPALGFWLCDVAFLPHTATVTLNAIARTLVRVYITHRHLLQWTTAAHTARVLTNGDSALRFWREMAVAPMLALVAAASLALLRPASLRFAAPLLLLWAAAPSLARYLSAPLRHPAPGLQPADVRRLRILARRTWAFFETFVGPADQWLPPDHFQEEPHGAPARRTSPTNIGMLQLSVLTALDFGYRGVLATALQLKNGFDTLDRMERFRGHFLNWYGTATLEPLEPRYVSTVDSGNLAASLLTVKQGCLELLGGPAVPAQLWSGYLDTLAVFREVIETAHMNERDGLLRVVDDVERCVEDGRCTAAQWRPTIARLLDELCPALDRHLVALFGPDSAHVDPAALGDLRAWLVNVKEHLERMQREMDLLLPWLEAWRNVPALVAPASVGGGVRSAPVGGAMPDTTHRRPSGPPPGTAAGATATGRGVTGHAAWEELEAIAASVPTVNELPAVIARARQLLASMREQFADAPEARDWAARFDTALGAAGQSAEYLRTRLEEAAGRAEAFVRAMDFEFLYDRPRHLFFVGYNVSTGRMDEHHYDLLASEARLSSFLAIASGAVPEEHWLHLGRPIGHVAGTRALLSWSGTMFEYLMPELLLREGEEALIGHSCQAAVREQIAYARQHRIPWGISESGYYQFDAQQNYQYRAFGVPGLGFKRGLDEDLVVAPYASLLALPFAPVEVAENLTRLIELGAMGRYGLYEAIDFTPSRRAAGEPAPLVRSFMAHHQGMVLAALNNFFHADALVRRFQAEPVSKTAELLLYERPPLYAPVEQPQLGRARPPRRAPRATVVPWAPPLDAPFPQAHVLSNGRYSVIHTAVGGGGSRWRDLAVTRWSPDPTLDEDGFRIYLQDQADGRTWTAFRDAGSEPGGHRVLFAPHLIELHGHYGTFTARQRILVVPDADVEIRHLTLTGEGRRRRVTVMGYGEVVLGDAAADRRHPAFSKLFVESEYVADDHALLFRRRPRQPGEPTPYLVHTLALPRTGARPLGYDAARDTFIGRGRSARAPAVIEQPTRLAGTDGATLDPVMVLAASIELPPNRARELAFITAVADTRDAALALARRYRALGELEWTLDLAGRRAEDELAARGLDPRDLPGLTTLLSLLLYPHPALRAAPELLARNTSGRAALWRHGISGDLPILLVRIGHAPQVPLLAVVLRAQAYWRDRGIGVDLVILNEHGSSYDAHVDDQVMRAVADAGAQGRIHRPGGGVFPLQADQMGDGERTALLCAARAVLDGAADTPAAQLAGQFVTPAALPPLLVTAADSNVPVPLPRPTDLVFDNGLGGFSADGSEYVIHLDRDQTTPAPWVNVIANRQCGFTVSERGAGYTWAGNSAENRLTPWSDDPVTDEPGESVYLRDEETGAVWSPTPGPAWGGAPYRVHHGIGFTRFEHRCREVDQELRVFVPPDDAVKITELRLTNRSARPRRLTVTYYVEWVLGTTRAATQPFIVPRFDPETETLTARNPWNDDFGAAVAFVGAGQRLHGFTADRSEFLGRHGDRARPAALARIGLASTVRAGADPCAALQVHVDLPAGETRTVHFLLGQGESETAALDLVRRYRDAAAVAAAWNAMREAWQLLLGARAVRSPDPAFDLMLNQWLPYQTLSARVWGRTGFYQSSGAFGFRDQLQDLAATAAIAPGLCRAHLLEAAAHQFEEGDVLHWWHPPAGAGIRTRCSDDLLWLPFVTAHYVESTGDDAVLSETAPYLEGEPLGEHEAERYARFAPGPRVGTLYEHCMRAIEKAGALGPHGLPLIGSGDWNDGMNLVGARGRGESVWLAWFLCATLTRFAPLCERMGERQRADELRQRVVALRAAADRAGWDGRWYRRGFYDDGTPLGSSRGDECRIDSIAQSWAVLSTAADPRRARLAMEALRQHLVREPERLLLLLTPPFDRSAWSGWATGSARENRKNSARDSTGAADSLKSTEQEPGYIKGYPAGVRENGGQYTHAAIWAVWAFAALGEVDRAVQLFVATVLPVRRADTADAARRYRVEPYVVAADIYSGTHAGRGGWTWYTGAAGWAYRFGWEAVLGLRCHPRGWRIEPSLPSDWPGCAITLRDGATVYEIEIVQPPGASTEVTVHLDGDLVPDGIVPRLRDDAMHHVLVTLRAPAAQARLKA
jgi:cyclic beta-1,2-glucan glucanotransferase